jgi:hypothetical protein
VLFHAARNRIPSYIGIGALKARDECAQRSLLLRGELDLFSDGNKERDFPAARWLDDPFPPALTTRHCASKLSVLLVAILGCFLHPAASHYADFANCVRFVLERDDDIEFAGTVALDANRTRR